MRATDTCSNSSLSTCSRASLLATTAIPPCRALSPQVAVPFPEVWHLCVPLFLPPHPFTPGVGLATWCATHAAESRGCRVVIRNSTIIDNFLGSDSSSSSTSWSPCPHEPPPHSTTCSHHADLDEQYGAAAGFEAHGALARPTVRLDQLPGAAEGCEGGSHHLLSPLTPSPGGSRGGQGFVYRRGECLQGWVGKRRVVRAALSVALWVGQDKPCSLCLLLCMYTTPNTALCFIVACLELCLCRVPGTLLMLVSSNSIIVTWYPHPC